MTARQIMINRWIEGDCPCQASCPIARPCSDDSLDLDFSFGLDLNVLAALSLRVDTRTASHAAVAIQFADALKEKLHPAMDLKGRSQQLRL